MGIGLYIHWELGVPDRADEALHRLNCAAARQVALYESDPGKAIMMAASARVVCAR